MNLDDRGPELTSVMAGLRSELVKAAAAASSQSLQFAVRSVRVDLAVALERSATAKAGVKFWVVEAGGEAAVGRSVTHTVSFGLTPTHPDGTPADVYVSGAALPNEE